MEARWKRADQDVFIATLILNPFYKTFVFRRLDVFTNAGIYTLLRRLWSRFYKEDPPRELYRNLQNYLDEVGSYKNMRVVLEQIRSDAIKEVLKSHLLHACYYGSLMP